MAIGRARSACGRAWAPMVLLAGVVLTACSTVPDRPDPDDGPEAACRAFFQTMDQRVEEAGVRDGIGAPPAAYPYLRSTRFLDSFADALDESGVRDAWLDAAQTLDREARLLELRHLEPEERGAFPRPAGVDDPEGAVDVCGDRLRQADGLEADDGPWREAADALSVPDEYITWQRAVGVYPVSRWFIRAGVATWQRGVREDFTNQVAGETPALRYLPAAGDGDVAAGARLLADADLDALGWPQLSETQWQEFFRAVAPVVEVERDAEHNRIGRPSLTAEGLPQVDTGDPVVYAHASGTRFGDQTLVQINYTWWFTERPLDHWFDLLGGRLDGLNLRMTFSTDGELLLVESMHNCGCYYQHYPVQGLEARSSADYAEPPLILPGPGEPEEGERLRVHLQDGSHYVTRLAFAPVPDHGETYALEPYDTLRSLPREDGDRASLFQADGLVTGTERSERWFFWVSGVPEPGAMRQYHRHATAFVGRRHFDDADLLERIYRWPGAD